MIKEDINFEENLESYLHNYCLEKLFVKNANNNIYLGKIPLILRNKTRNILMKIKKNNDYLKVEIFTKKIVEESSKLSFPETECIRKFINEILFYGKKNI